MVDLLKPKRGGFRREFGLGEFIFLFMAGHGPYDSPKIDPLAGTCQADIFHEYKLALMSTTALDRATRTEEKQARKEDRSIDPDNIERLTEFYFARMPYKAQGCRYHSFVSYFSSLQKLGWVEESGFTEKSDFQDKYPEAQPRKYFRLTEKGLSASQTSWKNPFKALYGLQSI